MVASGARPGQHRPQGWLIPLILFRALRQVAIKREVEPSLGLLPSLLLGAFATVLAVVAGSHLPLAETRLAPLLVPASLATMAAGFILLTARRKAISQVLGYLVLENGIFIFGLLLLEACRSWWRPSRSISSSASSCSASFITSPASSVLDAPHVAAGE
jgi:hypothetical protein